LTAAHCDEEPSPRLGRVRLSGESRQVGALRAPCPRQGRRRRSLHASPTCARAAACNLVGERRCAQTDRAVQITSGHSQRHHDRARSRSSGHRGARAPAGLCRERCHPGTAAPHPMRQRQPRALSSKHCGGGHQRVPRPMNQRSRVGWILWLPVFSTVVDAGRDAVGRFVVRAGERGAVSP
jgi:hypothetical protein